MSSCVLCGGATELEADPRLPRLRVLLCARCRDWVAAWCGWTRISRGRGRRGFWTRGTTTVEIA